MIIEIITKTALSLIFISLVSCERKDGNIELSNKKTNTERTIIHLESDFDKEVTDWQYGNEKVRVEILNPGGNIPNGTSTSGLAQKSLVFTSKSGETFTFIVRVSGNYYSSGYDYNLELITLENYFHDKSSINGEYYSNPKVKITFKDGRNFKNLTYCQPSTPNLLNFTNSYEDILSKINKSSVITFNVMLTDLNSFEEYEFDIDFSNLDFQKIKDHTPNR